MSLHLGVSRKTCLWNLLCEKTKIAKKMINKRSIALNLYANFIKLRVHHPYLSNGGNFSIFFYSISDDRHGKICSHSSLYLTSLQFWWSSKSYGKSPSVRTPLVGNVNTNKGIGLSISLSISIRTASKFSYYLVSSFLRFRTRIARLIDNFRNGQLWFKTLKLIFVIKKEYHCTVTHV